MRGPQEIAALFVLSSKVFGSRIFKKGLGLLTRQFIFGNGRDSPNKTIATV